MAVGQNERAEGGPSLLFIRTVRMEVPSEYFKYVVIDDCTVNSEQGV